MDSHDAIVGAQLRAARDAAGVPLSEVAAQLLRGKSSIAYYETGRSPAPADVIAWYQQRFGDIQDPVATLLNLGKADVERRTFLHVGYSTALSASALLPGWLRKSAPSTAIKMASIQRVGEDDVAAARDVMSVFSRLDQKLGGGHGRRAVAQYLTDEIAGYLNATFTNDTVKRDMFSAAGELAYLAGWMAFDNDEHAVAQHYFLASTQLSTEAADDSLTGHILRAMAHQAVDLGHLDQGLQLAEASVSGNRYQAACPRERALLKVVHAKALSAAGQPRESAKALIEAENNLSAASATDDEPSRVFFFSEASLAHETACALRDSGNLTGAADQFKLSVEKRKAASFKRTHAVTLGYLGTVQACRGELEQACATWKSALGEMNTVRSGRTRKVARDIRSTVAPYLRQGVEGIAEIDRWAENYLAANKT
ncbi:helix-turn-helix domain-containing protein [Nocardia sp. NBC_01388]|uniref:helix-turn-helix domain-containing protein n=1 Tax=Nocardia sp. NBC_01388 TaxID=2903596 RepID=UPI00325426F8